MAKTISMEDLEKELLATALSFKNGKEAKKFIGKEGTKLKRETKKLAAARVTKRTGEYLKGVSRAKPYKTKDGSVGVFVRNESKYGNTIEVGRVNSIGKDGKNRGYTSGVHVYKDAAKNFENGHRERVEAFVDEMLDKGMS